MMRVEGEEEYPIWTVIRFLYPIWLLCIFMKNYANTTIIYNIIYEINTYG